MVEFAMSVFFRPHPERDSGSKGSNRISGGGLSGVDGWGGLCGLEKGPHVILTHGSMHPVRTIDL